MLKTKTFLFFCLLAVPLVGAAQQRAASGPVEGVNRTSRQITVLGQTFSISNATRFAVNGKLVSPVLGLQVLAARDSVSITGIDGTAGAKASVVELSRVPYVPGATPVYVFGRVAEYSRDTAAICVGSLWIDVSTVSPTVLAKLHVGVTIEASGTQPSPTGKLVGPVRLRIGGAGSAVESIGGTGLQKQSIGGTGFQLQSIGGTGAQVQSIGGTGLQKQSIGGTGFQLQSIGGTGARVQSIDGTGLQKQSIGGTGIALQSIGGTGRQAQSIGGTGLQASL